MAKFRRNLKHFHQIFACEYGLASSGYGYPPGDRKRPCRDTGNVGVLAANRAQARVLVDRVRTRGFVVESLTLLRLTKLQP
jgi:hypothetical protein